MNWRSQQGASTPILLISFWMLVAFLGICCDQALYYVYREQFRTALEAGATAGAQRAGYRITVRLVREKYVSKSKTVCTSTDANGNPLSKPDCSTTRWWEKEAQADAIVPEGWERDVWTSHTWAPPGERPKKLWQVWPDLCEKNLSPDPPGSAGLVRYLCTQAKVDACHIAPMPDLQAAVNQARATYEANRGRWADQMADDVEIQTEIADGTLRVKMAGIASVPTHFLRAFGINRFPVDGHGVDGGPIEAEWIRVYPTPDGCPVKTARK